MKVVEICHSDWLVIMYIIESNKKEILNLIESQSSLNS